MTTIKPMLLTEVENDSILGDDSKWFQIKENGVRALVHIKDHKLVGLRNRADNPILYQFPELREIQFPFQEAILDAEICVFKDDKSVFYGGIDKRRSAPSKKTLEESPATMVVFDALKIDNEALVMKPYSYRYSKILESLKETDNLKVAKNFSSGKELWDKVTQEDLEGVVIKDPKAFYEVGKRSKNYIKLKSYKRCDVNIEKTEPNDKGTKIYGKTIIDGKEIEVTCQLAGIFGVGGDIITIKYLDIYNGKLIQPSKEVIKHK